MITLFIRWNIITTTLAAGNFIQIIRTQLTIFKLCHISLGFCLGKLHAAFLGQRNKLFCSFALCCFFQKLSCNP